MRLLALAFITLAIAPALAQASERETATSMAPTGAIVLPPPCEPRPARTVVIPKPPAPCTP